MDKFDFEIPINEFGTVFQAQRKGGIISISLRIGTQVLARQYDTRRVLDIDLENLSKNLAWSIIIMLMEKSTMTYERNFLKESEYNMDYDYYAEYLFEGIPFSFLIRRGGGKIVRIAKRIPGTYQYEDNNDWKQYNHFGKYKEKPSEIKKLSNIWDDF